MRIVHVVATPVGAPWLVGLAREQRRLGHDVHVILPSLDGTIAPALAEAGVQCHVATLDILSMRGYVRRARGVAAMVRLLRALRPDAVQSHLLPSVVMGRIASWIADVPVRLAANAGPLTLESDALGPIEIGTAFCDTRTIASCGYARELFARHGIDAELIYYAPDHARFDPAVADGARVRRELGIDDATPLIGLVAYFYPPSTARSVVGANIGRGLKGHEVLLRAVPRVLREFPNAKFALVGRGWGPAGEAYMRDLQKLARRLRIEHAVLFTGERRDVPDVLAALDISVHPSLTDNLGGTIESLLMARPMVVSDVRGYNDSVVHEETGLVVPAGDATALADSILRLLRDPALARRLGESGRRRMLDRFTLDRAVQDTEALLAEETRRAAKGYRLGATIGRALRAPFRLLPIVRKVERILRRDGDGMRVAQVAGAWTSCDWLVALCRDLRSRGYRVTAVIDKIPGDLAGRLDAEGIPHYELAMTFGMGSDRRVASYAFHIPIAALRLARILRAERIDIVHSHICPSVMIARRAAALARARHVAGISGPRHLEAALTRQVDRLTWWLDDATVAGCRHTRDLYAAMGMSPQQLECIYYGGDAEHFDPGLADAASARRALGVPPGAPLVAMVAHFYAPSRGAQSAPHMAGRGVKGHEDFLAAARVVARVAPEARFVIAGAAVMEAGEAYRQRLIDECDGDELLRDRVIFAGHVDDVPSLLAAADVAVQCSLTENLGGTIEALLMERPVVATRVGGMPESVRDGETGLLVPPSDPAALAAAILRLLENRDEAAAFGRAGRRLMLERFTFARTVDDVDALYRRLARRPAEQNVPREARA